MTLVAHWHALYRPHIWLWGILTLFLLGVHTSAQTLENQIDQAFEFLKQGEILSAHQQFTQMDADYGMSEAYQKKELQDQLRPIKAHTAYFAQDFPVALDLYQKWIQTEKNNPPALILPQFQLARCYQALQDSEKACQHYQMVYAHARDPNDAAIARLYHAKQLHGLKKYKDAQHLLQQALKEPITSALRSTIEVYAVKISLIEEDLVYARDLIAEIDWHASMQYAPQEFTSTLMALADKLYQRGHFATALECYRSVPPQQELRKKINQAILYSSQQMKAAHHSNYSIQLQYAQEQIDFLSAARQSLFSEPDYSASLYLKMGQCWLLTSRHQEAAILFRQLSAANSFSSELRSQAHYRWVLALIEGQQWDQAKACAQDFMRAYPAHPLQPELRYLVAQSLERQNKFQAAIEILESLIKNHPDHAHQQRWQFSCGYSYTRLESFESARACYRSALLVDPESDLSTKIRLWQALSYDFAGDHATSQTMLEQLQAAARSAPLYPEILFRLANVYYAQKAYLKAQTVLSDVCDQFPRHARNPQARVLLGDIYGIRGQLEKALASYRGIDPQQGSSFEYALFQTVKIYKMTDQLSPMRQLLEHYLALPDAANRPRVSEALYWLGWAYAQTEDHDKAVKHFEDALNRFDNDPTAQAIDAILNAYQTYYPQSIQHRPEAPKDFIRWLDIRIQLALQKGYLTRYARLQNFRTQIATADTTRDARLLLVHKNVPVERQPPNTLGSVGLSLAKRGYRSAQKYFDYLLENYATSPERGAAYYGQALLAHTRKQDPQLALLQLKLFFRETPLHGCLAEAYLLEAKLLIHIKDYELARNKLKTLLADKRFRGKNHALALQQCAVLETQADQPKRAIAYWQRIYTLYRSHPELVAEAYWQSFLLFCELEDYIAAEASLVEMQSDIRLSAYCQKAEFETALKKVRIKIQDQQAFSSAGAAHMP
jgi:tetratricopeptide (TPR) repeat protein